MNIGFIGLGAMGLPMAKNVARAGHKLHIMQNRRAEPVEELKKSGALVFSNPAELADGTDVVITVLPADEELRQVVAGEDCLASTMRKGQALIDMTTATSTTLLELTPKLRELGVTVIDAPVSGGTTGAAAGTLTIMVGAEAADLSEWRPLLETMGNNIYHVGAVGQGKAFKIVNQLMAAMHILTIGEAFGLGTRLGADPKMLKEVISASSGYSKMMDLRLDGFLLDGSYEPGFGLDLMKKDVRLAVESAHGEGMPATLGAQAHEIFQAASTAGYGGNDFSSAAAFLAQTAGSAFGKRDG